MRIIGSIFFICFCAVAGQFAIIKNPHAVIYSDAFMTSPIGYVKQGRKVTIGNTSQYRGKVFPIVVSGKIAYIPVADLEILDGSEVYLPEGHDSIIGLDIRKNRLVFGQNYFVSNFSQGKYSIGEVEEKTVSLSGLYFKKERVKKDNFFYAFGFEILNFSNEGEDLSIPSLFYERGLVLWHKNRFKLRGSLAVGFSPYAIYSVDPYFALNGFSYHGEINLEALFYILEESSIVARIGARSMQLTQFNLPSPLDPFEPTISGVMFSVAYSHSF